MNGNQLGLFFLWSADALTILAGATFIIRSTHEVWSDPRTRFEVIALWPLYGTFGGGFIGALVSRHWFLAAGGLVEWVLVGAIGSSLHPLMSPRNLMARRRSSSTHWRVESQALPPDAKFNLVRRACTLTAMLLFPGILVALVSVSHRWYVAVPVSCILTAIAGGMLRVAFASSRSGLSPDGRPRA